MFDLKEETRRKGMAVGAHASWWGAFILTLVHVGGYTPRSFAAVIVLLIGAGISFGLSLSRARLTDTIVGAFRTGMIASQQAMEETARRSTEEMMTHHNRREQSEDE